jgi:hypothetical protein
MAEMNENLIETIQMRTMLASDAELYSAIGESLPKDQQASVALAASLSASNLLGVGKDFYEKRIRPKAEDLICGNLKYCANRGKYDTAKSVVELVGEQVGKVVAKLNGLPDEAGGVAGKLVVDGSAAILKEGLNHLCRCSTP